MCAGTWRLEASGAAAPGRTKPKRRHNEQQNEYFKFKKRAVISSFPRDVTDFFAVLGCYAALIDT
jgi:hypothetical protein